MGKVLDQSIDGQRGLWPLVNMVINEFLNRAALPYLPSTKTNHTTGGTEYKCYQLVKVDLVRYDRSRSCHFRESEVFQLRRDAAEPNDIINNPTLEQLTW